MLLVLVQVDVFGEWQYLAVDTDAGKTFFAQVGKQRLIFALPTGYQRGEYLNPCAFIEGENVINHLVDGLRIDQPVAARTMRCADPRIKQTQVVVNLGDGAHGRTRIMAG